MTLESKSLWPIKCGLERVRANATSLPISVNHFIIQFYTYFVAQGLDLRFWEWLARKQVFNLFVQAVEFVEAFLVAFGGLLHL